MLDYYARFFPLVELNFTFYRLPTPDMLARLVERAGRGLPVPCQVAAQHFARAKSPRDRCFSAGRARGATPAKLNGPSLSCPNRRIKPKGPGNGSSSFPAPLRDLIWPSSSDIAPGQRRRCPALRESGVALVAVDVPALPDLYPPGLVQSTDRIYVRLHSPRPPIGISPTRTGTTSTTGTRNCTSGLLPSPGAGRDGQVWCSSITAIEVMPLQMLSVSRIWQRSCAIPGKLFPHWRRCRQNARNRVCS